MSTPISNLQGLNSIEVKSSVSTRLNPEFFDRKNKQRDKLKTNYMELNETTQKREETVRAQMNDLTVQLEVIKTKKRRALLNNKMQTDFYSQKIERLQKDFDKICKELTRQEAAVKQSQNECTLEESEKLKTFMVSLRPLKEAASIVIDERKEAEENLKELTHRLSNLEGKLKSITIEQQNNEKEASAFRANKQQLENAFEDVRVNFPLEFNEIVKEIEIQRQIAALTEKKSRQGSLLNDIDRRIAELERDRAKNLSDLEKWEWQRKAGSLNSTEEMALVELEHTLTLKCQDLGLIPLSKTVALSAKENGIDLQGCIIKEQYKLIEDYELKLKERAKVQNETFDKKIQELTLLQEQGKLENNDSSDMQLDRTMMDIQHSITQLIVEADYFNRKHSSIITHIEQWKNKHKKSRMISDTMNWPSDADILYEFKSAVQSSVLKADQFAEIEALAIRYIKNLSQRDGLTNPSSSIEIKANSEIKQQKSQIKMLDSQLNALQYERECIHKEFIKLVNIEKVATKKLKNLKEESEFERKQLIGTRLEQILKGKLAEMQKIQKGFGEAAIQRVRENEFTKLKMESDNRKKEIKKKIEDLYSNKGYWDSLIQTLQDKVKPSTIEEIKEEIQTVKKQIKSHRKQIMIISEAEDELSAKIESMTEAKKKEITRNYSKTLVSKGGGAESNNIDELYNDRNNKEEEIEQVEGEIERLQESFNRNMQKLVDSENLLKQRLTQLQEEFTVIEKNRNRALNLQSKLKALEKEMRAIGMSLFTGEKLEMPLDSAPPPERKQSNSVILSEVESEEEIQPRDAKEIVNKLRLEIEVDRNSRDVMGTIMSPISLSAHGLDEHESIMLSYKLNSEDLTSEEMVFLKTVVPLLNGFQLYKKFTRRAYTHFKEFDPILADKLSIENCGYGLRSFRLNINLAQIDIRKPKSLTKMEFRQKKNAGIESSISVNQIRAPTIPRHTMEIIKAQKKQWLMNMTDDDPSHEEAYIEMKTSGTIVYEDPAFQSRSRQVKFYPFFICMDGNGRVEVVADDYITFKQCIDSLNAICKFKKHLGRLRHHIEVKTS